MGPKSSLLPASFGLTKGEGEAEGEVEEKELGIKGNLGNREPLEGPLPTPHWGRKVWLWGHHPWCYLEKSWGD